MSTDSLSENMDKVYENIFKIVETHYGGSTLPESLPITSENESLQRDVNNAMDRILNGDTELSATPSDLPSHRGALLTETEEPMDSETEIFTGGKPININAPDEIVQIALTAGNHQMAAWGILMSVYNEIVENTTNAPVFGLTLVQEKNIAHYIKHHMSDVTTGRAYNAMVLALTGPPAIVVGVPGPLNNIKTNLINRLDGEATRKGVDHTKKVRSGRVLDATASDGIKTFQDPKTIAGIRKLLKEVRNASQDMRSQIWTNAFSFPPKSTFRQFTGNLRFQQMENQIKRFAKDIEMPNLQSDNSFSQLFFSQYIDYVKQIYQFLEKYYAADATKATQLANVKVMIDAIDKIKAKAAGNGKDMGEYLKDMLKLSYKVGGAPVETPSDDLDTIYDKAYQSSRRFNHYQKKFMNQFPQLIDSLEELLPEDLSMN